MARYWIYLNEDVSGPYTVEQLIRLKSFSRQTQVCIDDASGKPSLWISPAEIPELEHIFRAAHERLVAPTPASPPPKAHPKPTAQRAPRPYTPAVTLKAPDHNYALIAAWVVLAGLVVAAGAFKWSQISRRSDQARDQDLARALVENAHLPGPSAYSSLRQYIEEKNIKPHWEFERVQDALYHVTLSWYSPGLTVYALEANVQSQTVRGLNTAASTLLSEGFPVPQASQPKPAPAVKPSPAKLFGQAVDARREAIENGDFQAVWNSFSARKKSEMAKGGISQEGFIRVQGLTHRVESSLKQTILKTQPQSDTEMLVLIKQTQTDRPDIFVKQFWVFEKEAWKLDDEQKRSTAQNASEVASPKSEAQKSETSDVGPRTPSPAALPGMSH